MYNERNCQSSIRRKIVLDNGLIKRVIIVTGKHAFTWTIHLFKDNNDVKSLSFSNRCLALKRLSEMKKQFRLVGDVSL